MAEKAAGQKRPGEAGNYGPRAGGHRGYHRKDHQCQRLLVTKTRRAGIHEKSKYKYKSAE